jgi:hypothetical protein
MRSSVSRSAMNNEFSVDQFTVISQSASRHAALHNVNVSRSRRSRRTDRSQAREASDSLSLVPKDGEQHHAGSVELRRENSESQVSACEDEAVRRCRNQTHDHDSLNHECRVLRHRRHLPHNHRSRASLLLRRVRRVLFAVCTDGRQQVDVSTRAGAGTHIEVETYLRSRRPLVGGA